MTDIGPASDDAAEEMAEALRKAGRADRREADIAADDQGASAAAEEEEQDEGSSSAAKRP